MKNLINEYVEVAPNYKRSVNVDSDYKRDSKDYGYIVTTNVMTALDRIISGLIKPKGQKSFSISGLFGVGKSSFAVYLSQLLSPIPTIHNQALNHLKENAPQKSVMAFLEDRDNANHLSILITGRKMPVNKLILEGILKSVNALKDNAKAREVIDLVNENLANESWQDSNAVLDCLDLVGALAIDLGYAGILLIIDEAGKTLEYLLHDRDGGDIYVYQQIAEYAERVKSYSMLFLITLHQQMDNYSDHLSKTSRAEWTKVQERFENIRFSETASSTILMLSKAIKPLKEAPKKIKDSVGQVLQKINEIDHILPSGLSAELFEDCAFKAWPIHPCLLLALPYIFKRFAQNERSIFSYLISEEHFGFQKNINTNTIENDDGFIRVYHVYDYLLSNFEVGLSRSSNAKRLLEANDIIVSKYNLNIENINTLKTIAMLNVLSEISPLRSTRSLLKICLPDTYDLNLILDTLVSQSLITRRKLDNSFRIWEGSDVDIDERLGEAKRNLHFDTQLFLKTLEKHLNQKAMIARKHSLDRGVIRHFSIIYTDHFLGLDELLTAEIDKGSSGLIAVMMPGEKYPDLINQTKKYTKEYDQLIIAVPRQLDSLIELANELASLRWVEEHTNELRDDRIARRELNMRISSYEQELNKRSQTILDPRKLPIGNACEWYWSGDKQDLKTPIEISRFLSNVCDELYNKSPILKNELIARDDISNAASGARRRLMEYILTKSELETFGIIGYPPERSIYEAIIKEANIHAKDKKNNWFLQAPPKDNYVNLYPAWIFMEKQIFNKKPEEVKLDELCKKLNKKPYGIPKGVFPLLFTIFYAVHQDELFLYRQGSFLPDANTEHFDLLQNRLDLFTVKGLRIEGIQLKIIKRLANSLQTEQSINHVVKALYSYINNLPDISKRSNKIEDKTAIAMREAFLSAVSPEDLLFIDLPKVFGIADLKLSDTIDLYFTKLNSSLNALLSYASYIRDNARDQLLSYCNLERGEAGWLEIENRCEILSERIKHDLITPFINSVLNGKKDDHNPIPALSTISRRSFERWSDIDIDRFPGLAQGMAEIFSNYWVNHGVIAQTGKTDPGDNIPELERDIDLRVKSLIKISSTTTAIRFLKDKIKELEANQNS
jgi:hypothetical protein